MLAGARAHVLSGDGGGSTFQPLQARARAARALSLHLVQSANVGPQGACAEAIAIKVGPTITYQVGWGCG